jgi:hypothetical protein
MHSFVFVRTDIVMSQQIIQSCHATHLMAMAVGDKVSLPSIVLIGVPDKSSLQEVIHKLDSYNIANYPFIEPDFGMGLSAVATAPISSEQRKLLSTYQLWKEKRCLLKE